jgi:hypothetical protein
MFSVARVLLKQCASNKGSTDTELGLLKSGRSSCAGCTSVAAPLGRLFFASASVGAGHITSWV